MCGIAGIGISGSVPKSTVSDAVRCMMDQMVRRGPDAVGVWSSDKVVLGHRRLAILDLDVRSNQPMTSGDGRYTIVFNGEIYNYRELRSALEAQHVGLRTKSDTEVILELYAREGVSMLSRLRGMFAFALWDEKNSELVLARDPYGIKPLYYSRNKAGVLFASQVKALVASGMLEAQREVAAVAGFYLWGSVPEPWTMIRDIYALPAGHYMKVRGGIAEAPVLWHDIQSHWCPRSGRISVAELEEKVWRAVTDSVRSHLVADVPVSVFLSAGIDSAVVAGLAAELGSRVEGITLGFEEFARHHEDEVPVAAAVAAHYGLPHSVRHVSRAEFEGDIPRILAAMDQPSIDGVNVWFASKAAAERGYKVVLSGVGGDELFLGYSSANRIPRLTSWGRAISSFPGSRGFLPPILGILAKVCSKPKLSGAAAFMDSLEGQYFLSRALFLPQDLPALMGAEAAEEGLMRLNGSPPGMSRVIKREDVVGLGVMESTYYLRNQILRDADWASMAHSVELRSPLVDSMLLAELGPYVSQFADGAGKDILANSPKRALPVSVAKRPKTGFSLPIAKWLSAGAIGHRMTARHWARDWAKIVLAENF